MASFIKAMKKMRQRAAFGERKLEYGMN